MWNAPEGWTQWALVLLCVMHMGFQTGTLIDIYSRECMKLLIYDGHSVFVSLFFAQTLFPQTADPEMSSW